MKKLILIIFILMLPLMTFGKEIDCGKGHFIYSQSKGTVEDTLTPEQRGHCNKLKKIKEEREEIERAERNLKEAIREHSLLKKVLPEIKQTREIEQDTVRLVSKYKVIDKEFFGYLYSIGYALKEINQTEIVDDIAVTFGNLKKGLIKNGYSEEQAMRVITAFLGTKIIPVDM